ncbi:MAG: hypothetical protein GEV06_24805, partial [Luteitalea sp.]|nr:hypothetical protein [Luteitalea sp.]
MRRWLWILVGLFVAFLLAIVALVGAGAYYWHRHVKIQSTTSAAVETEFISIKRRFADQPPLLEMSLDGHDVRVVNLERRAALADGRQPRALHVLVYDEREGKRVNLSLPFWILRLAPQQKLKVDVPHVQLDRLQLSVDDLERAGPGIVLSHQDDRV